MPDEKDRYDRELELDDFDPVEFAGRSNRFDRMMEDDLSGLKSTLKQGYELHCVKAPDSRHILASITMHRNHLMIGRFSGFLPAVLGVSEAASNGERSVLSEGPEVPENATGIDAFLLQGNCTMVVKWAQTEVFAVTLTRSLGTHVERVGAKNVRYKRRAIRRGESKDLFVAVAEALECPEEVDQVMTF